MPLKCFKSKYFKKKRLRHSMEMEIIDSEENILEIPMLEYVLAALYGLGDKIICDECLKLYQRLFI